MKWKILAIMPAVLFITGCPIKSDIPVSELRMTRDMIQEVRRTSTEHYGKIAAFSRYSCVYERLLTEKGNDASQSNNIKFTLEQKCNAPEMQVNKALDIFELLYTNTVFIQAYAEYLNNQTDDKELEYARDSLLIILEYNSNKIPKEISRLQQSIKNSICRQDYDSFVPIIVRSATLDSSLVKELVELNISFLSYEGNSYNKLMLQLSGNIPGREYKAKRIDYALQIAERLDDHQQEIIALKRIASKLDLLNRRFAQYSSFIKRGPAND
jgi:hypothetical protein